MLRNIVLRGAAALLLTFSVLSSTSDLHAQKYGTGGTEAAPAPNTKTTTKTNTAKTNTATTKKADDFKIIEMVGYLAGNSMYNMYLTIGMAMDLFVAEKYDATTVVTLLKEQISFAGGCIERFQKMRDSGEFSGEEEAADAIIEVYRGLKKQAEWGVKYAESASESAGTSFESQRKKNWASISKLMGLDE